MCKINAATIAADGQDVGNALEQLATQPGISSAIAADLTSAAKGIISATSNWQEGSPTAVLEDAENVALTALNLIPLTAPFAGAVAIAFAGLNLLLANTKTQTLQAIAPTGIQRALIVAHAAQENPTNSPWYGKVDIAHHGDFRKGLREAWAKEAEAHPELGLKPLPA
jgi:hypothetical protein